ncbi:MAG TPA: CPBP family intramembrane glutamic endopeptidase [Pyrinomonadaceae bacterium]|nr:CPBP family intramembrane glutamic endopeptidase [Pyrinomonadaceae bacterium]
MDCLAERMEESKSRFAPFVVYLVLFHAAWVGWVYLIYPRMKALGEDTLLYALANIAVRLLIWVLPVFLYLRYVDGARPIECLKLKRHWKRGILIGLFLSVINFLITLARFGAPHPSLQSVTWNSILSTSLLIGFVEEIPYRGFILQKFQEQLSFWPANLISSLLFVSIHLPGWILLHLLSPAVVITVFIFGAVMAIIFKYTKSLWSVIVTHSLNDFLSAVIFRL